MNYSRLSRGEYWLLNLVVHNSCPIEWLDATNPHDLFNRDGHGMSRHELIDTLESMFSEKWIEAHIPFVDHMQAQPINRVLIEQILEGRGPKFQYDRSFSYQLTALGGAIWESFAQPRWSDYIDPGFIVDAGEVGEIVGATEYRVKVYFSLIHLDGVMVVSEVGSWDTVSPWNCTYWKTLPIGYRVRFVCKERVDHRSPLCEKEQLQWLKKWYEWK